MVHIITDPRCAGYGRAGHPERPQRITRTIEHLRSQSRVQIEWIEPAAPPDEPIRRAHTPEHIAAIRSPLGDFDADTPDYPGIDAHARRSVSGALTALDLARQGKTAFSLLRPPGHHATADQAMGFCYFNSIAIAAFEALASGAKRVAVFDFDVHHGNGTEALFLGRENCAFFSIHQYPAYPGTGGETVQNCRNYPVPPGAPRDRYRAALEAAIDDLIAARPDIVGISAGFDAYRRDPLSDAPLEAEDFHWLGRTFHSLGIPHFSVLEGGYSSSLPELILAYLHGLEGLAMPPAE